MNHAFFYIQTMSGSRSNNRCVSFLRQTPAIGSSPCTLLQYATESQLDGQFRIIIPKELLQFAKIENEVLILGMLERIEVWDPKVYNEYMTTQSQNESYESVAATIFKPPPE